MSNLRPIGIYSTASTAAYYFVYNQWSTSRRHEPLELLGRSFIGGVRVSRGQTSFSAQNAVTGESLEPVYFTASMQDVHDAVSAATAAFPLFAKTSAIARSGLLRAIADRLEQLGAAIVPRAMAETALPQARLEGELARTCGQLRLFATVIEEGSWQNARIDRALPERKPLPRPDLRSMLVPLGPVVVFGASNFPLAFSVAGGDTASALAAGNPVISAALSSNNSRSRPLRVMPAAFSNSARASSRRPSFASRSPRTLGSQW